MKNCFGGVYAGRRVLVTGHTGFKGSWLCEWLLQLGAEVMGLALPPPTDPALFDQLRLKDRVQHTIGDIRDLDFVRKCVTNFRPHFIFHLAAQPLVRLSYEQPVETYSTNVMGTVNVLEAIRGLTQQIAGAGVEAVCGNHCAAVMVTTDKCYENREWIHSYREEDPMGGYDPYSSSKGAAELVIAGYRRSFFSGGGKEGNTRCANHGESSIASARAGNVIGGGDWATDRIVPDCVRALQNREPISVRNRIATRPWQHVLEPLSGYLWLGACISNPQLASNLAAACSTRRPSDPSPLCSAFNFGPPLASNRTVAQLVEEFLKHWKGEWKDCSDPTAVHEAQLLNLSIDKAHAYLRWAPIMTFEQTIEMTVDWYRSVFAKSSNELALTVRQISEYVGLARRQQQPWAM